MRSSVNPHISYSTHFAVWEAAIAAGATLDELMKLEDYPKSFLAKLVAWHNYHSAVELHTNDAVNASMNKGGKR